MWRPLLLAGLLAAVGCSSEPLPPGPGFPAQVRAIRLFDGAGVDLTNHIFLYHNDTLHLKVRLYGGDGRGLLEVVGGLEMTMNFTPAGIVTNTPVPEDPLIQAVTTNAPSGTAGSLMVSLHFLNDGSVKTFGPFECLVH